MNNNPTITPQVVASPFKNFCMSVGAIPTSYQDSLDYYETLLWLIKFLDETVIPALATNGNAVAELQSFYLQLQTYVNDYFTNLDVQNEINNKLDNMTTDGTLTHLIKDYVDPIYQVYENSINNTVSNQNTRITNVEQEVSSLASGSPKGTYETTSALKTANPDTGVYIVTSNGHIYSWTKNQTGDPIDLGVYQAAEDSDTVNKLKVKVTNIEDGLGNGYVSPSLTWVNGAINPDTGAESTSTNTFMRCNEFIYATSNVIQLIQNSNIRSIIYEYATPEISSYISGIQTIGYDGNSNVEVTKGHYYRITSRINGQTGITSDMCPTIKMDYPIKKVDDLRSYIDSIIDDNVLTGKTIYGCGDSITFGANNNGISWLTKIAQRNNMILTNLAISGSTWVRTEGRSCIQDMITQMVAMTEPDFICISGGYNDAARANSLPLGEMKPYNTEINQSSAYNGTFDTTTFAGCIEDALYKLYNAFPNAKMLYVITYKKTYEYQWANTYVPVLKEILKKWSIAYVDFTENARLVCDTHIPQFSQIFTDGTHPNDKGYEIMADYVERELKNI